MTEQEWLGYTNIGSMLEFVKSERKLRLYNVACCRSIWHLLSDERSHEAVLVSEQFADGLASTEELASARAAAWAAANDAYVRAYDPETYGNSGMGAYDKADAMDWVAAKAAAWVASHEISHDMTAGIAAIELITDDIASTRDKQRELLRDIVNPFFNGVIPTNSSIIGLATAIYEDRDYSLIPVLGDALEDAGCTDPEVLGHCRSDKPHCRGCWVVDKILGRE